MSRVLLTPMQLQVNVNDEPIANPCEVYLDGIVAPNLTEDMILDLAWDNFPNLRQMDITNFRGSFSVRIYISGSLWHGCELPIEYFSAKMVRFSIYLDL